MLFMVRACFLACRQLPSLRVLIDEREREREREREQARMQGQTTPLFPRFFFFLPFLKYLFILLFIWLCRDL